MSVLFIITVLLLAAVAYRIYRRQQELNFYRSERDLGPSQPPGLSDEAPEQEKAESLAGEEPARDCDELNASSRRT